MEKEEPKQETLEEAAEKFVYEIGDLPTDDFAPRNKKISESEIICFIAGAKWQAERMYSEEEAIQLLIKFNQEIREVEDVREWFEQFKNK